MHNVSNKNRTKTATDFINRDVKNGRKYIQITTITFSYYNILQYYTQNWENGRKEQSSYKKYIQHDSSIIS
jgi:DNA-binding transcriptional regulator YiaG